MSSPWWSKFAPPPPLQDAAWLDAFAPKTPAPTEQLPVSSTPTPGAPVAQLESVILAYNNGLSFFASASVYTNAEEGVTIHKIDTATAAAISARVKPAAAEYNLPVTYALACLAIESTLDPQCQNGNLGVNSAGVKRSNPDNDPMLYDMGIAQLKLTYLVGSAPGVTDHDSALAFALDIDKAIPYFASLMATKYLWAQNVVQQNNSSAPDVRLNASPLLLATGAYNFGDEGMLAYYEDGQFPSHCQHVIDLEQYFATKWGRPSVFASLPK